MDDGTTKPPAIAVRRLIAARYACFRPRRQTRVSPLAPTDHPSACVDAIPHNTRNAYHAPTALA